MDKIVIDLHSCPVLPLHPNELAEVDKVLAQPVGDLTIFNYNTEVTVCIFMTTLQLMPKIGVTTEAFPDFCRRHDASVFASFTRLHSVEGTDEGTVYWGILREPMDAETLKDHFLRMFNV